MHHQIPESEAAKIREAVFAGRKIEAIKGVREITGLGLADAKRMVEEMEEELRRTMPEKFTAPKGSSGCTVRAGIFVAVVVAMVIGLAGVARGARAREYLNRPDEWFASAEGRRIAANVISWQSEKGSWPKAVETASQPYRGERAKLKGTFDNGATCDEIRFLGRAYVAAKDLRCGAAAIKGIEHVLEAQHENGGWPQTHPPGTGYARHITFNDDAMVRVMYLMREVASEERWKFVGEEKRMLARGAFERGVGCILKCQMRDEKTGKLTAWCAQHDERDFRPRPARTYELVSLSGSETVGMVRLLMSIERPNAEVIATVEGAVEWIRSARMPGIKQVEVADAKGPRGKDKRVVADPGGRGLWARFYEIETGKAMFVDRDGVKKYTLAEIGYERRNGYAWLGEWGEELLEKEYPEWRKRIEDKK